MLSPAGAKQTDQSRAPRGERDHHSVAAIDLVGFTAIFAVVIRLRGRRCRCKLEMSLLGQSRNDTLLPRTCPERNGMCARRRARARGSRAKAGSSPVREAQPLRPSLSPGIIAQPCVRPGNCPLWWHDYGVVSAPSTADPALPDCSAVADGPRPYGAGAVEMPTAAP